MNSSKSVRTMHSTLRRAGLAALAGLWFFELAPACGSDSDTAGDTAATSTAASGAGGAGQVKGGGKKGAAAASAHQKGGSTAEGKVGSAASQGPTSDGLTCDATLDGVGWCVDDANILFCYEGTWWLLDCSGFLDGGFCGYDVDLNTVDCYAADSSGGIGGDGVGGEGLGGAGFGGNGFGGDGVGAGPGCYEVGSPCFDASECCSGYCDDTGTCA